MHSHSSLDLSSRLVFLVVFWLVGLFVCLSACLFVSFSDLSINGWLAQDWSDMDEGWLYGEWETGPWWAFHDKVL